MHGIPDDRVVEDGDLVTIDVGVTLDGAIADSAYTFGVGQIDAEAQRLLDVAQDALAAGIAEARLGNRIGDISHAVQTVVEGAGFAVVRSLVGHGVGRHYHEDPHVPNFGEPGRGPRLSEGMTIAIEPMITVGSPDVWLAEDGWTISTEDGSLVRPFRAHGGDPARRARGSSRRASGSPPSAAPPSAAPRSEAGRGRIRRLLLHCAARAAAGRLRADLSMNIATGRA